MSTTDESIVESSDASVKIGSNADKVGSTSALYRAFKQGGAPSRDSLAKLLLALSSPSEDAREERSKLAGLAPNLVKLSVTVGKQMDECERIALVYSTFTAVAASTPNAVSDERAISAVTSFLASVALSG